MHMHEGDRTLYIVSAIEIGCTHWYNTFVGCKLVQLTQQWNAFSLASIFCCLSGMPCMLQ